jgi:hypothetical protein
MYKCVIIIIYNYIYMFGYICSYFIGILYIYIYIFINVYVYMYTYIHIYLYTQIHILFTCWVYPIIIRWYWVVWPSLFATSNSWYIQIKLSKNNPLQAPLIRVWWWQVALVRPYDWWSDNLALWLEVPGLISKKCTSSSCFSSIRFNHSAAPVCWIWWMWLCWKWGPRDTPKWPFHKGNN